MPYFVNNQQDDEDQQKNTDINNFSDAGGGGGAPITSTAPASTQSAHQTQGQNAGSTNTGSNYQNLDKYLAANSSQNFGNQVTGKLAGEQSQASNDQTAAANQFNQQAVAGNQTPGSSAITNAVANAQSFDPSTYQAWENQSYQGPTSIANSAQNNQFTTSTKNAQADTGLQGGSDSDRMTLLNNYFGNNKASQQSGYGYGQQALDDELVQNTAGYGQSLNSLQNGSTILGSQQQALAQGAQNTASMLGGQVAQSAANARAAVGIDANGQIIYGNVDSNGNITAGTGEGAIGNLEDTVNSNVDKQNAVNAINLKAAQQALASGIVPAQLQSQLGLYGKNTYGADLSPYVTAAPAETAANVMTPEQLAQLKALQGLAGVSGDTLDNTTLATGYDPYTFNAAGAQSAVNAAQAAQYQQYLNSIKQQIAYALSPAGVAAQNATNAKNQAAADAAKGIYSNSTPLPGQPQTLPTNGISPAGSLFPTNPINLTKVRQ